MEITWMNEPEELVPSNNIINAALDMKSEILGRIEPRLDCIEANYAHGLSDDILCEGNSLLNFNAKDVETKYENVEILLELSVTNIGNAAITKETEELNTLKVEVNKKLESVSTIIQDLIDTYTTTYNKIKNLAVNTISTVAASSLGVGVAIAGTSDTAKKVSNFLVSLSVPIYGYSTTFAINSVASQTAALATLYELFHGNSGYITGEETTRSKLEEKIDRIDKRLGELSGLGNSVKAWESTDIPDTEYRTTGTSKGGSNTGNTTTSDKETAAGNGKETDDTETADPTDATEKENSDSTDKEATFTGTDKVIINGKEYTIRGYVTTSDGQNRVIYGEGKNSYYIDKETGTVQLATKQVSYGVQHYVVDGEEFNNYHETSGSMKPTETFEVSETDAQYASVKEKEVPASQTGDHTGGGAGHEFDVLSDYTPSIEVKDSTNQTIQLYSNKSDDDLYYKDSNGDMKKVIKIGQEYVIDAVSYTEK